jgi:hypothetical protein
VVELQSGFDGTIANNEVAFMILEGPMIIIASFALTVLHPGFAFSGYWHAVGWSLRGKKPEAEPLSMEAKTESGEGLKTIV